MPSESPFLSLYLLADWAKDQKHYNTINAAIFKENPHQTWQVTGHDRVTLDQASQLGVYRRLSNSSTNQYKIYGPDPKHFDDLKSVEPALKTLPLPGLHLVAFLGDDEKHYKAVRKIIQAKFVNDWETVSVNTFGLNETICALGAYRWAYTNRDAAFYAPDPKEFEYTGYINAGPEQGEDAKPETSAVDHPEHYGGDNTYEVIKVIEAWELDFPLGNAVKYIARAGKKDAGKTVEDLEKAIWYINRKIKSLRD